MTSIEWRPDKKKLQQFGWAAVVGFPLLAWLVSRKLPAWSDEVLTTGIGMGVICGVLSFLSPRVLIPVYWIMMGLASVIGPVVGLVVLGVIFFLVVTPIAFLFRIMGRDELRIRTDSSSQTCWLPAPEAGDAASYFRQF